MACKHTSHSTVAALSNISSWRVMLYGHTSSSSTRCEDSVRWRVRNAGSETPAWTASDLLSSPLSDNKTSRPPWACQSIPCCKNTRRNDAWGSVTQQGPEAANNKLDAKLSPAPPRAPAPTRRERALLRCHYCGSRKTKIAFAIPGAVNSGGRHVSVPFSGLCPCSCGGIQPARLRC